MDLIVDANILFAALIKDSTTSELLFHENLHLYAPEFLLEEFSKHKKEILTKTKRTEHQFEEILTTLKELITLIPKEEFRQNLEQANIISPDPDDAPYIALALKLKIPIWSNDKDLKKQKAVTIYTTQETYKILLNT